MQSIESKFNQFFASYVTCALWSSVDDEGRPLDERYGKSHIDGDSMGEMRQDCHTFIRQNGEFLEVAEREYDYSYSRAGNDFWLTRNGHGAGFWDRDLGEVGDKLSESARSFGEASLYESDDGQLHYYNR